MTGFIGLHIVLGAGNHSDSLKLQYQTLCQTACRKAVDKLKCGESAVDVACFATQILEDSELTNAGFGSNLTWDGTVECDASVMDGTSLNFGAVGAVDSVKNPIMLARKILDDQSQTLTLQRVSPCVMVGEGARKVAEQAGLTVPSNILLTDKTLRSHRKYRRKVENMENGLSMKELTIPCINSHSENLCYARDYTYFPLRNNNSQ